MRSMPTMKSEAEMDFRTKLDSFLRAHPLVFAAIVLLLTVLAFAVMLGQVNQSGLVYKAF